MLHAHLLHIPLEPQPLLVSAADPFLPAVDPKWVPQRTVRTPEATMDALLECRMEERKRKEEERAANGARRKGSREQRREEESEEQRRQCQEWLSEWAGD